VDLVAEHHQGAQVPQHRAGRGPHRGQHVGRAVRAGQAGMAHRPGHHDRLGAGVQQVEQVRGLLDGVGALDHHGPGRPGREPFPDRGGQLGHVADGQGGAGHLPEIVHLDVGVVQPGHRVEQLARGQGGNRPGGPGRGHRYRAAEGEHRDPGAGRRGDHSG
jgi:hypothetical protein